jgi:dGTPase
METSKYTSLLRTSRFRKSAVAGRNILLSAESDRGRLLFCPAFRRLQQKAQVFSLESNAAVRSRLTHSLEVSQTGRYIADEITLKLLDNNLATQQECFAIATFVETACLMHDIGNPPFGHFGEAAIAEWFTKEAPSILEKLFCSNPDGSINTSKLGIIKPQIDHVLADFKEFDGNPQGLRVVAKLQKNSDIYGLNLTKTTLASYLKYIRESGEAKASPPKPFTKKAGYFSTERALVRNIWEELGYNSPQRFPLAYIMEAADDIAYCISDLEDSIEKQLLNKKQAFRELIDAWAGEANYKKKEFRQIGKLLKWASLESKDGKLFTYTDFRTNLNRILVDRATVSYINNHDKILDGTLESLIPDRVC